MKKPRVLIIDDSKLVRKWCSRALSENGMKTDVCQNGKEGLKKVFSFSPDVILTDLEMPVMDGLSTIKALKSNGQTMHIPIVAFTAKTDFNAKIEALEAGANDFLHKETDEAELVARMRSQVRIKNLEDGLIEERNKLFNILNDLAEAVVIVDHKWKVIFLNSVAYALLGVDPDSERQFNLRDILERSSEKHQLLRALQESDIDEFELNIEGESSTISCIVSISQIYTSPKHSPGRSLVFRDVTKDKRIKEMQAAFYSMIAHDLRSPITVINGYVKLLLSGKAGELNETQKEFLEGTRERADAMLKLADEFLTVTKFETSFINLELSEVDVQWIIENAIKALAFIAKGKNIKVELQKCGRVGKITADRDKLHKVFINLLDNALKYTMENGEIRIILSSEEGGAQVEIRDNGIGMGSDEMKYVFDRYRRMSTAKERKIKGTGLGLAIVKEIVEAHHGRVWVDSKLGKGSSFFVFLPAGKDSPISEDFARSGV